MQAENEVRTSVLLEAAGTVCRGAAACCRQGTDAAHCRYLQAKMEGCAIQVRRASGRSGFCLCRQSRYRVWACLKLPVNSDDPRTEDADADPCLRSVPGPSYVCLKTATMPSLGPATGNCGRLCSCFERSASSRSRLTIFTDSATFLRSSRRMKSRVLCGESWKGLSNLGKVDSTSLTHSSVHASRLSTRELSRG